MSYGAHITSHTSSGYLSSDTREDLQDDMILLDRRYRVARAIEHATDEQRFPAHHVELDVPVCITVLHPHGAVPTGGRSALLREASASSFWTLALQAANLRHPVLPRVRDSFLQGDTCYVVTDDPARPHGLEQDVSGWHSIETLAQRLERTGHLSLREALIFGLHLCDALAYLQQVAPSLLPLTTIVPRHLMLPQPNTIMIGDLRPARWLDAARCVCVEADLPYSAPEITTGGAQDVRADMYSIAAVVYHMLAGAPPARSALGTERRTLTEIEPLIPAALSDVIEQALRPDPDARFADANAFGRALAGALTELLPALVARINAPYAGACEQTLSRAGSEMTGIATMLQSSGTRDDPHDRHYAETIMPAIARRDREPFVRRRPPKRQKRSALAAISAVLGLQPKIHMQK